jgi:hypothetical protein
MRTDRPMLARSHSVAMAERAAVRGADVRGALAVKASIAEGAARETRSPAKNFMVGCVYLMGIMGVSDVERVQKGTAMVDIIAVRAMRVLDGKVMCGNTHLSFGSLLIGGA